jgi:hypothetical protein
MKNQSVRKIWKVGKWIFASVFALCVLVSVTVYLMRDKIVDRVVMELNKNLNTPIDVSSIDLTFWGSFPNVSVDFNDLYIQDAIPEALITDTFFYSKRLRLKFNPFDLINKEYKVKKVEVSPGYAHIKNFKDGRNNYTITKPSEDPSSGSFEFSLNEVALENFRMDYSNFEAKQFHSTFLEEMVLSGDFTERIIDLNAESNLRINFAQSGEVKLVQNQTAYFDLNLLINQDDNSVVLKEAPVVIAGLPFTFGLIVQANLIDVQLRAKNLQLVDVAKNFHHQGTDKINDFQGSGFVQFDLHYKTKRKENSTGEIACNFGVKNGNIVEPSKNLRISNINVLGYYGNTDARKGEHLNLETLQFQTVAGPFTGNLLLTHFDQPRYQGKAIGKVDLAVLQAIFPIPSVQSTSGQVKIDSQFDISTTATGMNLSACSGDLNLMNVHCQLKEDKRYFDHISGNVFLNNDLIDLEKISLTVGRSDLALNGKIEHLQNYLNKKGNLLTNLEIRSAYLDVQDFASNEKAEEIQNGRNYILPNDIDGNIHLLANNLQYEKHQFKKLATQLKISGRNLNFTHLNLQNAGADIDGNVLIQENSPEIFTISTNASSNNISFQPLFKEWDNFQQDVLSADNISGIAQVKLNFKAPFDLRSGIDMNKVLASVALRIDEGKLKNVEAFKSITASLQGSKATKLILRENNITNFENNLLDLHFQSLQNTLTIQNGVLTIPRMTIASNALTVNLAGTHNFNNQVDYHFDFNLRDIKKVKVETEFGDVVDDGTGLRLFAHMYGDLDNPTIKWDKEQKQLLAKETVEQEKLTAKQMLKAEFGLFKKDTAVIAYKEKAQAKEEIRMEFGKQKEEIVIEKAKKDTKIGKTFQKWKEDAKKENEGTVEYE